MELTVKNLISLLLMLLGISFFLFLDNDSRRVSDVVTHVGASPNPTLVPAPIPLSVSVPAPSVLQGKYQYIEITESCGPLYEGHCIPAYYGPGSEYREVEDLRNGMVLKIQNKVTVNGQTWYRVHFDEWLRHPERVEGEWYVPAVAGRVVGGDGEQVLPSTYPKTNKRIVVDRSEHMIYAYEGSKLFLRTKVSTGLESSPTPVGTFTVFKKTPSRYMQGPLPGINDNAFDLPGVPWNLYFTEDGAVIHGSYWHDRYGTDQSSGCINLPPEVAKILYDWAELGTTVTVQR